eukprot:2186388-Rhodomonas_salina.1
MSFTLYHLLSRTVRCGALSARGWPGGQGVKPEDMAADAKELEQVGWYCSAPTLLPLLPLIYSLP